MFLAQERELYGQTTVLFLTSTSLSYCLRHILKTICQFYKKTRYMVKVSNHVRCGQAGRVIHKFQQEIGHPV